MHAPTTRPAAGYWAEADRVYDAMGDAFKTIDHRDDAWFDPDDRTGESLRRFCDQLDMDARRLARFSARLRQLGR